MGRGPNASRSVRKQYAASQRKQGKGIGKGHKKSGNLDKLSEADFDFHTSDNEDFGVSGNNGEPVLMQKTLRPEKVGKVKGRQLRRKEERALKGDDALPRNLRDLIRNTQKHLENKQEARNRQKKRKEESTPTDTAPSFYSSDAPKANKKESNPAATTTQKDKPIDPKKRKEELIKKDQNPLSNVTKRDDETMEQFTRRVNTIMRPYIQRAIKEPDAKERLEKKKKVQSNATNAEKKKPKQAPKQSQLSVNSKPRETSYADSSDEELNLKPPKGLRDFSDLRDTVKFGEVVHEPPSITKEQKLFSNKLDTFHFTKLLNPDIVKAKAEPKEPLTLRDEVIARYRLLKQKKRGTATGEGEYL